MTLPVARDELVATLEQTQRLAQRLAEDARDHEVPVADLVAKATLLERLDQRREELIGQLKRGVSAGIRAAAPGPPIREVVLRALGELEWPQNAGFLEEYLWAKRQLQLESRAFASLRRDERRAWRRAAGARAYVVPALNPDGSANPHWLTSSAWELERRVIASPETERLLDLRKISALQVRGALDSRGPLGTLLERYAEQVLTIEPPPVPATAGQIRAWRAHVRAHATALIKQISAADHPLRARIARRLAGMPEQERVWGREKPAQESLSRDGGSGTPASLR